MLRAERAHPRPERGFVGAEAKLAEEAQRLLEALAELRHLRGRGVDRERRLGGLLEQTLAQRRVGAPGFDGPPRPFHDGDQDEERDLQPAHPLLFEGVEVVDGDGGAHPPDDEADRGQADSEQHPPIEDQPEDQSDDRITAFGALQAPPPAGRQARRA